LKILYLSYTGLTDPLGQSQVFSYLRPLSEIHRITLITFEKANDRQRLSDIQRQKLDCEKLGIRWIPLRYHHRPRLIARFWDLAVFLVVAIGISIREKFDVVHCRSYFPAFIALFIKKLVGTPFIFDMRALLPDEMIAAGRLKNGSILLRFLRFMEFLCLAQAARVVSLTDAGVEYLRDKLGHRLEMSKFSVIPTCVDLEMFRPKVGLREKNPTSIGSVGTVVSGWFRTDWLLLFFAAQRAIRLDSRFYIFTSDPRQEVISSLTSAGTPFDGVEISSLPRADVPGAIGELSAVALFYATGPASTGRCPTRLGEVLACGVPVVVNSGVGDVESIVRRYRVGVVVGDAAEMTMRAAAVELAELMRDPELGARCRFAAEDWFSLKKGADFYNAIYGFVAQQVDIYPEARAGV
jgi:glycosyltransferase involved in cell wall biosynthesis